MPPYPKSSPLSDICIRKMIGSACVAHITLLTYEKNVLDPTNRQGIRDLEAYYGQYSKMHQGTIPEEETCKSIEEEGESDSLWMWKNHPFWHLLFMEQYGPKIIENALRTVRGSMQRYIWTVPPEKGFEYYSARYDITIDNIKAVAKYWNFHALVTLTAWAREARANNILMTNYHSAFYSRKIFAQVICNTPQLFIRWPLLAEYYKKLIWVFPQSEVSEPWFNLEWDKLMDEMEIEEKKARNRGVKLTSKHIFRRINKYN